MGMHGRSAGAAALACAALAFGFQDSAVAQNRGQQATPQALRRALANAERELRGLETEARALTAEAQTLTADAEALRAALEALDASAAQSQAAAQANRDTVEALVIARLFAERGGAQARRAGAAAQLIARDAVAQSTAARAQTTGLTAARLQMAAAQDALTARNAALQARAQTLQTAIAAQSARRTQLAGDLRSAEIRVAEAAAARRRARVQAASAQAPARPAAFAAASLRPILTPARADLVRGYGQTAAAGLRAQGLTVRTAPGAALAAPAAGTVAYSGPLRERGGVVIVSLDSGEQLVLAGLQETTAQQGQRIAAGQSVGAMSAQDPAPELYIEVRRDGRPVDPGRWLAAAQPNSRRTG